MQECLSVFVVAVLEFLSGSQLLKSAFPEIHLGGSFASAAF